MTVIIHCSNSDGFFGISDTMITTNATRTDENPVTYRLPGSLLVSRNPAISYYSLSRKIIELGNGSILMWAGSTANAASLAQTLREINPDENYVGEASDWLERFLGPDVSYFFSHPMSGHTFHYRSNCDVITLHGAKVIVSGSGRGDINKLLPKLSSAERVPYAHMTNENADYYCASMISSLMSAEIFGNDYSTQKWGAAFEGVYRKNGQLHRLTGWIHSFSVVSVKGQTFSTDYLTYAQSRRYVDDNLVLLEAYNITPEHLNNGAFVKRHVVPPLIGHTSPTFTFPPSFAQEEVEAVIHSILVKDEETGSQTEHQFAISAENYLNGLIIEHDGTSFSINLTDEFKRSMDEMISELINLAD